MRLTGTHIGCDTASCGACTVLLAQVAGEEITTIEGITPADGPLHPMQAAFNDNENLLVSLHATLAQM